MNNTRRRPPDQGARRMADMFRSVVKLHEKLDDACARCRKHYRRGFTGVYHGQLPCPEGARRRKYLRWRAAHEQMMRVSMRITDECRVIERVAQAAIQEGSGL